MDESDFLRDMETAMAGRPLFPAGAFPFMLQKTAEEQEPKHFFCWQKPEEWHVYPLRFALEAAARFVRKLVQSV